MIAVIAQIDQKNQLLKKEWEKQKQAEELLIEQQLAGQNGEIKETDIPVNRFPEFVPEAPSQVEVTDTMLQILAMEREKNTIRFLVDQLSVPLNQVEQADAEMNRLKNDESYSRVDISLSDLYAETITKEMQ